MALIQMNYSSKALARKTNLTILLPELEEQYDSDKPVKYKVLYLLHGLFDDHLGWLRYTSIENYIRGTNLAVVMPNVEHGFYTDMEFGPDYYTFVSSELPTYLSHVFPFYNDKENVFIAGNSMGGYGALKCAIKNKDKYGKVAVLSPVLDINDFVHNYPFEGFHPEYVFGKDLNVKNTENDLYFLLKQIESKESLPKMWIHCGKEDFLYDQYKKFINFAKENFISLSFGTYEGDHTWKYWETQVHSLIEWILHE